jgi:hypothetical protein
MTRIQTWADTLRPTTANFAVALTLSRAPFGNRTRILRGVLLKAVPGLSKGALVKAGVFTASAHSNVAMLESRAVKWTVL